MIKMVLTETKMRTYSSTGSLPEVGICAVSYGSREAAMIDSFLQSKKYNVKIYIADKQKNPFNYERATKYLVIKDLDINAIADFIGENRNNLDLVIPGSEGPIIDGLKNVIEAKYYVPCICPSKEYAIEASKVAQRELIQSVCPDANPKYMVFRHGSQPMHHVKDRFYECADELGWQFAIKPDKPGFGKGVGVSGDHFNTYEKAWEHFCNLYEGSDVIVEEKIEGEEFSMQCWSDGELWRPVPLVRDYKRRFDDDKGENTGSMGSYSDTDHNLPFMSYEDWSKAVYITNEIFKKLRGDKRNPDLIGMPMYNAFVCSKDGLKLFEINSRPGDPEIINSLLIMENDFVDLCTSMVNGSLGDINHKFLATVVTYLVPPNYGGGAREATNKKIDLSKAYALVQSYGDRAALYPGSAELRDDGTYMLKSRTAAACGVGRTITEAREISQEIANAVIGDLERRSDIASEGHIEKSVEHMKKLRD